MADFLDQWMMLPTNANLAANDPTQVWAFINPRGITRIEYRDAGSPGQPVPTATVYLRDGAMYTLTYANATNVRDHFFPHSVDLGSYAPTGSQPGPPVVAPPTMVAPPPPVPPSSPQQ